MSPRFIYRAITYVAAVVAIAFGTVAPAYGMEERGGSLNQRFPSLFQPRYHVP